MRHLPLPALFLAVLLTLFSGPTLAKTPYSTIVQPEWLKEVMPTADSFSEKELGEAPVYRAYRKNSETGESEQIGFVFVNRDYPPMRVGYAAPIDLMVGMTMDGVVTNIKIMDYIESYMYSRGDFVDSSVFLSQFRQKPISDEYRLHRDIDGLTAASATSTAIARSVGETARRVARYYLGYGEGTEEEQNSAENAKALLAQLSWQDMIDQGIVTEMSATTAEGAEMTLAFTYIGRRALGDFFIGEDAYNNADTDASFRAGAGDLMLIAPRGEGAGNSYRPFPMSIQQGDVIRRVAGNRFASAGDATQGAIASHANYGVAVAMHPDFDLTQPFTIIYHSPGGRDPVSVGYALGGVGLTLARNESVLSEEDLLRAQLLDASFLTRLVMDPPWGATPWIDVILLLGLFAMVMGTFLTKNEKLRWATLTATLFYLGFYKNGFLSISHITNTIKLGPEMLTTSLPTLMIVVFTVITTIIWGRVFCSTLCPFGAVQDFLARFTPKRWKFKMPQAIHDKAIYIKYGILALILVTAVFNANLSIFQYFEPFGTLFFFSPSVMLWAILLVILVACMFVERFYCRYVCPLGAALGVVSLVSPLRIKRVPQCTLCKVCEHACPTGAIRGAQIDFKECVRCDVCETKLINLAGTCRHPMEEITRRTKEKHAAPVVDLIPVTAM